MGFHKFFTKWILFLQILLWQFLFLGKYLRAPSNNGTMMWLMEPDSIKWILEDTIMFWPIFGIVVGVLLIILIVLYIMGRKLQKKQDAQQQQIEANKQTVSMLIIDKKKMKMGESGLPASVIAQTPKMMRRTKLPIVKAKVGPQILSLVCDNKIFDMVPVKKEVKATVSGIYITEVRGIRGPLPTDTNTKKKKKGRYKRWVEKMQEKAGAKPL